MQKKFITVTDSYNLTLCQSHIDFVDVPLDNDLELFIDPFKLEVKGHDYITKMNYLLSKHFSHLIKLIKCEQKIEALKFINGCSERYTHGVHLGYSNSKYGKSVGPTKTLKIYNSFSKSNAVKSGNLRDIEESILLLKDISYDTISDIILSICKEALLEYSTTQQAKKHGLNTKAYTIRVLDNNSMWVDKKYNLPYNQQNPDEYIILVPKDIVTHNPRLTMDRAYSYMWYKLKNYENKELNLALALVIKGNVLDQPISKKDFQKIIPKTKDNIIAFFEQNPQELQLITQKYKMSSSNILSADKEIEKAFTKLHTRLSA